MNVLFLVRYFSLPCTVCDVYAIEQSTQPYDDDTVLCDMYIFALISHMMHNSYDYLTLKPIASTSLFHAR
jgi:hypothetical protein